MANFSIATVFIASISLLFALSNSFSLENPTDRRILVLVDDLALKSSHSIFFSSLQTRGFELDFKLSDDPKIALQRYGQYLYDGLILFSPTIERFGGSLDVAAILDFVDSGKDLIVAADASASDLIRNIAAECGVDFDEDSSAVVIDHGSYAVSGTEGDHTLIAADDFIQSDVLLGTTKIEAPVLFKGIGHSLNPANSLARNNARVLFSGSLDLFSNKYEIFCSSSNHQCKRQGAQIITCNRYAKSGNQQFVTELSKWVFHERGHLKAVNVRHHRVGETDEPAIYRINDDLEYLVEIYEWSGSSWEPYVANDVQIQFYMMSPYVLKTMSTDKKGLYRTSFKVPDVYGVFQFKVEYQRLGYTSLSLAKQIPVRPFRHNEYERFIPTAFPYYGASFSTMAAFFIFSFVYLYSK
ncbi:Dolichyl-diphosphooligosaccharide--protein glycosyltransferase subunit WBP1 [Cynara cardunculus var. scolymus]|uniref:Dolichyl-diphosphooligosaccharide--protein glycosyltransferase 48 kDa subunit n=1 Tax=Cynara cardunculus var. scolymus TaxID=59895 RepID=A0A103XK67_CYNCS|nr:Dolichyl-diphosphooligosaccharide--protein glycosyltransferase subunit WBP1 [Cynara cardunculus var. scolymus]